MVGALFIRNTEGPGVHSYLIKNRIPLGKLKRMAVLGTLGVNTRVKKNFLTFAVIGYRTNAANPTHFSPSYPALFSTMPARIVKITKSAKTWTAHGASMPWLRRRKTPSMMP